MAGPIRPHRRLTHYSIFVFHLFFSFQLFSIFISLTGVMKYENTFCLFLLGLSFGHSLLFASLLHVYVTLLLLNKASECIFSVFLFLCLSYFLQIEFFMQITTAKWDSAFHPQQVGFRFLNLLMLRQNSI